MTTKTSIERYQQWMRAWLEPSPPEIDSKTEGHANTATDTGLSVDLTPTDGTQKGAACTA